MDATGTIGKLACEISLNKILNERQESTPWLIKKIINLLVTTRHQLKQLQYIPDASTRHCLRAMLKEHIQQRISDITGYPVKGVPINDVVTSHTMCCINAYFAKDSYKPVGEKEMSMSLWNHPDAQFTQADLDMCDKLSGTSKIDKLEPKAAGKAYLENDMKHMIGNPVFAIETNLEPLRKRILEAKNATNQIFSLKPCIEALEIIDEIEVSLNKIKSFISE